MTKNPTQVFIVRALTRTKIAESLNEAAENLVENDDLVLDDWVDLTPDDDRLTDEFCQAVADQESVVTDYAEDGSDEESIAISKYESNQHWVEVLDGRRGISDWE